VTYFLEWDVLGCITHSIMPKPGEIATFEKLLSGFCLMAMILASSYAHFESVKKWPIKAGGGDMLACDLARLIQKMK
jgi:hypothetical protein